MNTASIRIEAVFILHINIIVTLTILLPLTDKTLIKRGLLQINYIFTI